MAISDCILRRDDYPCTHLQQKKVVQRSRIEPIPAHLLWVDDGRPVTTELPRQPAKDIVLDILLLDLARNTCNVWWSRPSHYNAGNDVGLYDVF